jgi:beta-lactamase class A
MNSSLTRRGWLVAAASATFGSACASRPADAGDAASAQALLAALETSSRGRLGVAAVNTADGARLMHRADERFAVCSTFKVIAASAILDRSARDAGLLQRHVDYSPADLVSYSPVTSQHVTDGMTVAALCAAALRYSDNTAGNLLMKLLGGPPAVTAFARAIGDNEFRLDRWETELNTAVPGDPRDTSTPAAMATSLQRLALGDALGVAQREQLITWMRGNTTGNQRIRAAVPADWSVADKTGGGDYGATNDIAVLWPSGQPPIVLALYFTQDRQAAEARSEVLAAAARIVVRAFNSARG